ncbi:penicillin epimerase [Leptolyngbya sp. 'hensonii']|uniref:aminotransferase class V-fold PLP-dependent enzyme n=1 Tax=Leptolyngbya sp. 'hensonii' TaxID=1922337 RepID=UPI00094F9D32|nr:aminotransferase class V-fold PLP-dependent enzyme [Leptolyngbya sp. 'hensonii']OLP18034.1 penicillin epimerase [Leptolyngbya sp. 'hensonii']
MTNDTAWSKFWSLDPTVTFLNHGSFGACPIPVLQVQQELRDRLERQPLHFFGREWEGLLDQARRELAAFVGADPEELAFVPNATTGVNTVLRSLLPQFGPGDELLTTNHEYNACRNGLNFVAEQTGATVVVAEVPFPIADPDQVVEAVLARASSRTRLALVDHVSSQTALIFPLAELVGQLADRGIPTLVDGAHAPGMIPLNLSAIGAAYYTGNCHKWLCAPKGAAFLYVPPDRQGTLRPLTISHGANSPRRDRSFFHLEFDWTGTGDPTAYLAVPEAIRFLGSLLPGGWPELMASNHDRVLQARQLLSQTLSIPLPAPAEMIGAMATLPLPEGLPESLYEILLEQFQIEVPIIPWTSPHSRLIRISAQIYNQPNQYQHLARSLLQLHQERDFS